MRRMPAMRRSQERNVLAGRCQNREEYRRDEEDFDMTVVQEMKLDHGFLVPMPLLFAHAPAWEVKTVPLVVNVIQHPIPTGRRCLNLGRAIRKAVEWRAVRLSEQ